jgi:hypothetical protein
MATRFQEGSRVKRPVDVYDFSQGYNTGTVVRVYSLPEKRFRNDLVVGPYDEVYDVLWDDWPEPQGGYLPHGLEPAD